MHPGFCLSKMARYIIRSTAECPDRGNAAEDFRYTDPDHSREGRGMKRFFYAKIALTNLKKTDRPVFRIF